MDLHANKVWLPGGVLPVVLWIVFYVPCLYQFREVWIPVH